MRRALALLAAVLVIGAYCGASAIETLQRAIVNHAAMVNV